jgi:hypothetical protein
VRKGASVENLREKRGIKNILQVSHGPRGKSNEKPIPRSPTYLLDKENITK